MTLLSELDEPPAALLASARAAAVQQVDRRGALEKLRYEHDLAVGRRQRGRLAVTLGIAFTLAPLARLFAPDPVLQSHGILVLWSATLAIFTSVWFWLARAALATTLVNRRLFAGILFLLVAQSLLVACLWQLGVTVEPTHVLLLFLYFVFGASRLGGITRDFRAP